MTAPGSQTATAQSREHFFLTMFPLMAETGAEDREHPSRSQSVLCGLCCFGALSILLAASTLSSAGGGPLHINRGAATLLPRAPPCVVGGVRLEHRCDWTFLTPSRFPRVCSPADSRSRGRDLASVDGAFSHPSSRSQTRPGYEN